MLIVKSGIDLKKLEKFGFKERHDKKWYMYRNFDKDHIYKIYVCPKSRLLQIKVNQKCFIKKSLQSVIYNLTKENMLECVDESFWEISHKDIYSYSDYDNTENITGCDFCKNDDLKNQGFNFCGNCGRKL